MQKSWEDGDLDPGESVTLGFIASPGGTGDPPRVGRLKGTRIVFNADPPGRHFARYVDVTLWPTLDLAGTARAEGARFYTLDFATLTGLGMVSFWSANRDNDCPGGKQAYVSPTCSSILQERFEFTHIFLPFTR